MDIEFVLQDAYALVRPQWKLLTTLEEAGSAFAEACKENYKTAASDKLAELEEAEDLDDENEADGRRIPLDDGDKSSDEDGDVGGPSKFFAYLLTSTRTPPKTSLKHHSSTPTTKKPSSSPATRTSATPKPMQNSTASSQR